MPRRIETKTAPTISRKCEQSAPSQTCQAILRTLRASGSEHNRAGMARYGINTANAVGVSVRALRKMVRPHRGDHELAAELWASNVHEARILAVLIDDPTQVAAEQVERWLGQLDSWDLCDVVCNNLFRKLPGARAMARRWTADNRTFVRRAGFVMMACLAVHDKAAEDRVFEAWLPLIRKHAADERNFVKKAVNWALRQIGKRNPRLRRLALELAEDLRKSKSSAARWVGSDAARELSRHV